MRSINFVFLKSSLNALEKADFEVDFNFHTFWQIWLMLSAKIYIMKLLQAININDFVLLIPIESLSCLNLISPYRLVCDHFYISNKKNYYCRISNLNRWHWLAERDNCVLAARTWTQFTSKFLLNAQCLSRLENSISP